MNDEEFKRLHAKLVNFPPYDWEDDVGMLLAELDRYHQELAFIQEQYRGLLQKWPQFRQLDIAQDALIRIASMEIQPHTCLDNQMRDIARAAIDSIDSL